MDQALESCQADYAWWLAVPPRGPKLSDADSNMGEFRSLREQGSGGCLGNFISPHHNQFCRFEVQRRVPQRRVRPRQEHCA